jgi:hypothetical protein
MSERTTPSTRESRLGRRLRREALESRPAFSETLHRRILARIEPRRLQYRSSDVRRKRSLMAVAAAACLLCAVAIGWRLGEMRRAQMAIADSAAESPLGGLAMIQEMPDRAAAGLDGMAASIDLTPPPARLSSDARRTVEALMERLPIDVELASE